MLINYLCCTTDFKGANQLDLTKRLNFELYILLIWS